MCCSEICKLGKLSVIALKEFSVFKSNELLQIFQHLFHVSKRFIKFMKVVTTLKNNFCLMKISWTSLSSESTLASLQNKQTSIMFTKLFSGYDGFVCEKRRFIILKGI